VFRIILQLQLDDLTVCASNQVPFLTFSFALVQFYSALFVLTALSYYR